MPPNCVYNGVPFAGVEDMSVGYAYGGAFISNIFLGHIILEHYGSASPGVPNCEIHDTNIALAGNGTLLIRIFRTTSSTWAFEVWNDGIWVRMKDYFSEWSSASSVEYGQEIANLGNVEVPVNYILHARVAGRSNTLRPVSSAVLVAPLTVFHTESDPPWVMLDSVTGDYTSVTSKTIP